MEVWGWIVVYAVGLTLLQLLVYRYLVNSRGSLTRRVGTPFGDRDGEWSMGSGTDSSRGSDAASPPSVDDDTDAAVDTETSTGSRSPSVPSMEVWPEGDARTRRTSGGGRQCPHCGAENEPDDTFSRCWNCTRQL